MIEDDHDLEAPAGEEAGAGRPREYLVAVGIPEADDVEAPVVVGPLPGQRGGTSRPRSSRVEDHGPQAVEQAERDSRRSSAVRARGARLADPRRPRSPRRRDARPGRAGRCPNRRCSPAPMVELRCQRLGSRAVQPWRVKTASNQSPTPRSHLPSRAKRSSGTIRPFARRKSGPAAGRCRCGDGGTEGAASPAGTGPGRGRRIPASRLVGAHGLPALGLVVAGEAPQPDVGVAGERVFAGAGRRRRP